MKKLFPILFLLISVSAFSQKVKIKKGVASVDKQPYLQIDVKKKVFAGIYSATFNSIEGEPLIEFEHKTILSNFTNHYAWNVFKFVGTDIVIEVNDVDLQNVKKPLIKFFYENNLIADGALDEAAVGKLKEKYPEPLTETYEKNEAEQKAWIAELYKIPERNKKAKVILIGSKIYQGEVLLGSWEKKTYEYETSSINLGRFGKAGGETSSYQRIQFFNPDNIPLAYQIDSKTFRTGKDGLKHDMTEWVSAHFESEKFVEQISVFLMKNGYL